MNSSIQNQPHKKKENEEEKSSKQDLSSSSTKQPTTTIITSSPPPSTSSSPSHEFSFTISLHPPPSSTKPPEKTKTKTSKTNTNTNTNTNSFIDLSPADDIFFHGHLLPLHFLSQLPTSPRSSSNSLDSFTLPIKELLTDDQKPMKNNNNNNNSTSTSSNNSNSSCHNNTKEDDEEEEEEEPKERIKAKSFSFLRFSRWRKGYEIEEKEKKKKMSSSVTQILRKYVGMVRPLLFYKGGRSRERSTSHSSNNLQCRQTYSFSGNLLSLKGKQELRGGGVRRGGEYSAPASMWTSPTNSGLLLTTPVPASSSSSSSESTMEELQSAIQAAIAHCKNSTTLKVENKQQCEIN